MRDIQGRDNALTAGDIGYRYLLRVLEDAGAPERVVFHCFSGDAAMAKLCADRGYYMSFAGNVTFGSAQQLRDAAAVVPPELLLVETDAPFLAPVPHRGRPCEPAFVADTAAFLADLRGEPRDALARATSGNFYALFAKARP